MDGNREESFQLDFVVFLGKIAFDGFYLGNFPD